MAVSFSGPGGSLALAHPDWSAEINWDKKATSSELATVKLTELLAERGVSLTEITHILVNVGPGSFTGIRVGLNLARTLAYALRIPIAPIDALAALAHAHGGDRPRIAVALRAVQTHYYVAAYARGPGSLTEVLPPTSLDRRELDQWPATEVLIEGESPGFTSRVDALDLVRAHLDLPDLTRFISWEAVNPLYVRGSEAEEKMKKGLLKPL